MSIKSKADFPDLSRGLDRYEGLQRRSEQERSNSVGRLLAGMDVIRVPGADGRIYEAVGRLGGGSQSVRRWSLIPAETQGGYRMQAGRVFDGDVTVTLKGLDTVFVPAPGRAVWLEKNGANYGVGWYMTLKYGTWKGSYDYTGEGGSKLMSVYRKRLISFHRTRSVTTVPVTALTSTIDMEQHAGDYDFQAESSLINDAGKAVAALRLIPY